jgi:ketosteroid isomerase-like protein
VSAQKVDLVRSFFDAYHRDELHRWADYLDADVVMIEAHEFPGATDRYGREAVVEAIADWGQAWSEMSFEVDEFEVFGALVLVTGRMHMRGEGTGMVFENPAAFHFSIEDDSITRVEIFLDVEEGRRRAERAQ